MWEAVLCVNIGERGRASGQWGASAALEQARMGRVDTGQQGAQWRHRRSNRLLGRLICWWRRSAF